MPERAGASKSAIAVSRSIAKLSSSDAGTESPGGLFRCSRMGLTNVPFFCNP
jgi:hypothetical protein